MSSDLSIEVENAHRMTAIWNDNSKVGITLGLTYLLYHPRIMAKIQLSTDERYQVSDLADARVIPQDSNFADFD